MMKSHRIMKNQSLNLYVSTWADLEKQGCVKKASLSLAFSIYLYLNLEEKHNKLIGVITSGEWRRD